jgi:alpha-D-glucose phosphate-specific phosphoglucomutase
MPTPIKFGTDGWRGVIAEDFTFANVRIATQGVADYLIATGKANKGMVVGHDARFASEYFAAAAAEVLAGNGITAYLTQTYTPTPVISYSILTKQAAGAINITASHNPPIDNGFKLRSEYAGAADPETLAQVEQHIAQVAEAGPQAVKRMPRAEAERSGLIQVFDPAPEYLRHLRTLIDPEPIKRAGISVVIDSMWGAGAGWLRRILEGGATQLYEIHGERNPIFPEMARPEPIAANLQPLLRTVRERRAHIGIATDGDADRVGVCDEHGEFIDQLRVYGLLALYLLEVRGWRGTIVKTLSTTSMLEKLGKLYNVPVVETGVGFKFVAPAMLEHNAIVGGEESGGYAFRGHIPERDGILAGLFILDMCVQLKKTPSELVQYLFSKVGEHYYDRIDLSFPAAERERILARIRANTPQQIDGLRVVDVNTTDGFKYLLEDGSWLLIRFSGTEPIMRIYTETTSRERVPRILQAGRELAGI